MYDNVIYFINIYISLDYFICILMILNLLLDFVCNKRKNDSNVCEII